MQCRFSGNSDSDLSRCLSERGEKLKETGAGAKGRRGDGALGRRRGGLQTNECALVHAMMRMPHLPPQTHSLAALRTEILFSTPFFFLTPPNLMFFFDIKIGS